MVGRKTRGVDSALWSDAGPACLAPPATRPGKKGRSLAKTGNPRDEARVPRYSRKQAAERRRLLIEAAIACLGEGGMAAFTIDRICRTAGVSRGLINHHFDGKDGLLAAVYESMTAQLTDRLSRKLAAEGVSPETRLTAVIEASFAPDAFGANQMTAWLALWGEVSTNPKLQAVHRKLYALYRDGVAEAIGEIAAARGRDVEADALAIALIALIDGLWLECCLDPSLLSPEAAMAACCALLEARIGAI